MWALKQTTALPATSSGLRATTTARTVALTTWGCFMWRNKNWWFFTKDATNVKSVNWTSTWRECAINVGKVSGKSRCWKCGKKIRIKWWLIWLKRKMSRSDGDSFLKGVVMIYLVIVEMSWFFCFLWVNGRLRLFGGFFEINWLTLKWHSLWNGIVSEMAGNIISKE